MNKLQFILALLLLFTTSTAFVEDSPASAKANASDEFIYQVYEAMNAIVKDYPNNFKNIIGGLVSEDDSNTYSVNVKLPGAKSASISSQINFKNKVVENVYTAVLYKYFNKKDANQIFKGYENILMNCQYACCTFGYANLKGGVAGTKERSTVWILTNKDNPNLEKLKIQLRIYPNSMQTKDNTWKDGWTVVLNIRQD